MLVVITGNPCSGKSGIATRLAEIIRASGLDAVVIDENEALHLKRSEAYTNVVSEKNTRGHLRSEAERAMSQPNRLVILDSLNNIKGYRYELWCLARAAATRYCVLHVDVPPELCRAWNELRSSSHRQRGDGGDKSYPSTVLEDLLCRYERPESRNRWDSPLYTIRPHLDSDSGVVEVLERLIQGNGADRQHKDVVSKTLAPTMATNTKTLTATNQLYEIDKALQDVIEKTACAGNDVVSTVQFEPGFPTLTLHRTMSMAELRRHKRSFLKLATQSIVSKAPDPSLAKRMFIEYLADKVKCL